MGVTVSPRNQRLLGELIALGAASAAGGPLALPLLPAALGAASGGVGSHRYQQRGGELELP
jgi:hypothetical protein